MISASTHALQITQEVHSQVQTQVCICDMICRYEDPVNMKSSLKILVLYFYHR